MKHHKNLVFILCLTFFDLAFSIFVAAEPVVSQEVITIGHVSQMLSMGINQKDADVAIEILVERMTKAFKDYRPRNVIYPTLEAAIQESKKGRLDILTLPSINYLNIRSRLPMTPEFSPSPWNSPENELVFLVNKKRNINSLDQLRNKNIIIKKDFSYSLALIWLDTLLLERSLPEGNQFFQTIKPVDKESKSVLPVFFGQADACIVHRETFETMISLNPQVGKQLKILFKSPPFLMAVTCYHNQLDNTIKDLVIKFSETADQDPEGKQILMIFKMRNVFRYRPEYLKNVEDLYNKHKKLKMKIRRN